MYLLSGLIFNRILLGNIKKQQLNLKGTFQWLSYEVFVTRHSTDSILVKRLSNRLECNINFCQTIATASFYLYNKKAVTVRKVIYIAREI